MPRLLSEYDKAAVDLANSALICQVLLQKNLTDFRGASMFRDHELNRLR
jgi:hypothetical protein